MSGGWKRTACEDCEWWVRGRNITGNHGECRYSAPTFGGWPGTDYDDWCGDWSERDEHECGPGSPAPQRAAHKVQP